MTRKDFTQNQIDAILSFLYNTLKINVRKSNTLYMLNNKY
ncbi:MAG: hypothetical protein ACI4N3_01465 [Alphaproteobacteria bacterium]